MLLSVPVGVSGVAGGDFWSMLVLCPTMSSHGKVSFRSKSLPTSASQGLMEFPERFWRLNEQAAFATSLRRRRRIPSRRCSEFTSGPSKSLATIRNPPRGKRVIFEETSASHRHAPSFGKSRDRTELTKKIRRSVEMYAMARFSSSTPLNGAEAVIPIAMAVARCKPT